MLSNKDIERIVAQVQYKDWQFNVKYDGGVRPYVQLTFNAKCSVSGVFEKQHGRKWLLSHHMTESEVVQTCMKAVLAAVEHEAREEFMWAGQPIFRPHLDVRALWELSASGAISKRQETV